jgi:hypothetical protein
MDSAEDSGDSMSDEETDQDSNYRETKREAAKTNRLKRNKAVVDDPLQKKAYRLRQKKLLKFKEEEAV